MGIQQIYTHDNAANFSFSDTEIDSGVGKLSLEPNPNQVFAQDFSSDSGFTYDSGKAEFSGGVLQQKDQTPADSKLGINFASSVNANWNKDGSTAGTLNGSPSIVSGKLQCHGVHGVRYVSTNNGVGTIKFKYTPNYTGSPPSNVNMVGIHRTTGNQSRVVLTHSPSGNSLRITISNNTGSVVVTAGVIGLSPSFVSGNEYEIELNWDSSTGTVRIFIDGTLHGTGSYGAWTHGTGTGVVSVGADAIAYNAADATFDDVIKFDTVQHTTSYTAGYTVPDTIYTGSKVDGPNFSYSGVGTVLSVDSGSVTESGSPRYIVGGQYWNGSAWAVSDGSYAQANDFATALANFGSFDTGGGGVLPWSVVFTDGNTQSSVDDFEVEVTGQRYIADGYIEPLQPIEVASISAYISTITEPANTTINVILKIDGTLTYHNGAAWVTSDGSISQSNTIAEVNSNVGSLSLGANSTIYVRWVFNTTDQQVTPTIESAAITYNFGAVEASVQTCQVYGYLKDISNDPVVGATVSFDLETLSESTYQEATNRIVSTTAKSVTTDSNGYFTTPLIRTSEYSEGGSYSIQIILPSGDVIGGTIATKLLFEVPDSTTKDITDLLPAA